MIYGAQERLDPGGVHPRGEVGPAKEGVIMSESSIEAGTHPMAEFINLLLCCPRGGNPASCPFHDARKLSFEEKANWVRSLSHDEILAILALHRRCQAQTDPS